MSRTEDLSVDPQQLVGALDLLETHEGRLATQAGHSAYLRVFPEGLVVSRVVIRLAASMAAASPVGAEASTVAVLVVDSTVVAAVDNLTGCRDPAKSSELVRRGSCDPLFLC
jgi:hypothetical protein